RRLRPTGGPEHDAARRRAQTPRTPECAPGRRAELPIPVFGGAQALSRPGFTRTYAATAALGYGRKPGPGGEGTGPPARQLPQSFPRLRPARTGVSVRSPAHRAER